MSWSTEHENSLNDIPRSFLEQFEDTTCRGDIMPNFTIMKCGQLEDLDIILYIDELEPSLRHDTTARFFVFVNGDADIFRGETLEELITWLDKKLDSIRVDILTTTANVQIEYLSEKLEATEYVNSDEAIEIENWFTEEMGKVVPQINFFELFRYTSKGNYEIALKILESIIVDNG